MEDRIRFIEHQGKRILLIDVSNCSAAELAKIAQIVPSYVESEPLGSVLLLADFTGAEFDRIAIDRLKESTVFDRPHLKQSAWPCISIRYSTRHGKPMILKCDPVKSI